MTQTAWWAQPWLGVILIFAALGATIAMAFVRQSLVTPELWSSVILALVGVGQTIAHGQALTLCRSLPSRCPSCNAKLTVQPMK
jgi:type II secretory pathway component PulF